MRQIQDHPSDADTYVRERCAGMPRPLRMWAADDGSLVWEGRDWDGDGRITEAVGPTGEALLREVFAAHPDLPRSISVTRPTTLEPVSWSADWDYRWTDVPPPYPPRTCLWLDTVDQVAEVATLLAHSAPHAAAKPGDYWVRRWAGVRDPEGLLVACAADISSSDAHGRIGGVATHVDARGQGFAADVCAWLSHQMFSGGAQSVVLAMYAENVVAGRLYTRLGFRGEHPRASMEVDL